MSKRQITGELVYAVETMFPSTPRCQPETEVPGVFMTLTLSSKLFRFNYEDVPTKESMADTLLRIWARPTTSLPSSFMRYPLPSPSDKRLRKPTVLPLPYEQDFSSLPVPRLLSSTQKLASDV